MSEYFPEWRNFAKQQVVVKTVDGGSLEGRLVSRDRDNAIILDQGAEDRFYLPIANIVWIRVKRQDTV
ncbi:MAG: hypothetical protein R3B54_14965 [Bdellovibrionota bacterium]